MYFWFLPFEVPPVVRSNIVSYLNLSYIAAQPVLLSIPMPGQQK